MFVGCSGGFRKSIRLAKCVGFCQSYIVGFGTDLSCSGVFGFVPVIYKIWDKVWWGFGVLGV